MLDPNAEFKTLFTQFVEDTGASFGASVDELAIYASEEAARLSSAINEPGFDHLVTAARDNVVLRAALQAVDEADKTDQRLLGLVQGALRFAAAALAA